MTDDRESDDAADWLSAQFGSHDADDADENADAAKPDTDAESLKAKPSDNPAPVQTDAQARQDAPEQTNAAEQTDAAAGSEGRTNTSPSGWPPATPTPPVLPASPVVPPSPVLPATPVPPATVQPADAVQPAAPKSSGFSWGLTPGGSAAAEPEPTPAAPPPTSAPQAVTPPPAQAARTEAPLADATPGDAASSADGGQPAASIDSPVVPLAFADSLFAPRSPFPQPDESVPTTPTTAFPTPDGGATPTAATPADAPPAGATPVVPTPAESPDSAFTEQTQPAAAHRWPFAKRADPAEEPSPAEESAEAPAAATAAGAAAPGSVTESGTETAPGSESGPASDAPSVSIVGDATSAQAVHPEPEPFDGSLAGAPSVDAEPRTMALPWESAGTELFTPAAAGGSVAEPVTELLSGFETVPADAAAGSAAAGSSIDSLFGDTQFRDYEAEPATSQNPFARSTEVAGAGAGLGAVARKRPPRASLPRSQKILLWIAGALAALLILIGLFYLGTRLSNSGAAAPLPSPSATATPTPTPTPTALAVGPVAPGTYKWDRLLGGECLAPYDSPWAEKFTVVDCGSPHPAQMVARGTFAEPAAAATDATAPTTPAAGKQAAGKQASGKQTPAKPASTYPGVAALQTQINLLCSAPTVINFAAAGAYSDIQFTASYPATDKQWSDGDRSYYCFVTRSSGDALTGSVAVAPAP